MIGIRDFIDLDRRIWPFADVTETEKAYQGRIKAKTNADPKSPRKYRLILDS
jgi:hypothetical protein